MQDIASIDAGCRVLSATARDDDHPPSNIIDGLASTFWCTTGLFPHEFILTLESSAVIKSIAVQCFDVKDLMIEGTEDDYVDDFQPLAEKRFSPSTQQSQYHEFSLPEAKARHLRFIIKSGYGSIIAVHKVVVIGSKLKRMDRF